ncbi:hypothetical protein ACT6QH_13115 [Xanthobacter sp. TB0139]|uniref:hypothetical protein n=1 Tax=Xanthobacter sp. TB0139 TaxID=3459178 RepID=UPI00403920CD
MIAIPFSTLTTLPSSAIRPVARGRSFFSRMMSAMMAARMEQAEKMVAHHLSFIAAEERGQDRAGR